MWEESSSEQRATFWNTGLHGVEVLKIKTIFCSIYVINVMSGYLRIHSRSPIHLQWQLNNYLCVCVGCCIFVTCVIIIALKISSKIAATLFEHITGYTFDWCLFQWRLELARAQVFMIQYTIYSKSTCWMDAGVYLGVMEPMISTRANLWRIFHIPVISSPLFNKWEASGHSMWMSTIQNSNKYLHVIYRGIIGHIFNRAYGNWMVWSY